MKSETLTLDEGQRLNLSRLLGVSPATNESVWIYWEIQDRIALKPEEEQRIGYEQFETDSGQAFSWRPGTLTSIEFEFSEREMALIRQMFRQWGNFHAASRAWLEPLLGQLFPFRYRRSGDRAITLQLDEAQRLNLGKLLAVTPTTHESVWICWYIQDAIALDPDEERRIAYQEDTFDWDRKVQLIPREFEFNGLELELVRSAFRRWGNFRALSRDWLQPMLTQLFPKVSREVSGGEG